MKYHPQVVYVYMTVKPHFLYIPLLLICDVLLWFPCGPAHLRRSS